MKTRKILPLLALAVVALFALSSCDAMLESLFPADTGQLETQGLNTITVEADVTWDSLTNPGTAPLRIEVRDGANKLIDYRTFETYYTGFATLYYYAEFDYLKDGTYYLYAYVDDNTNGKYDLSSDLVWGAIADQVVLSGGSVGQQVDITYYVY